MPKWLLLIPTEFEHGLIAPLVERLSAEKDLVDAVCGFGPIAAAAQTAALISKHQPDRVLLVGIAGGFGSVEIGSACRFSSVGCYGVGLGTGAEFQTAETMGWFHWTGQDSSDRIGNVVQTGDAQTELQLLTVCAASQTQLDVERRKAMFPDAVAEDMEGFAVAVACQIAQKPFTIVRGISNIAGDRDKSRWKIEQAMIAAMSLAEEVVGDE